MSKDKSVKNSQKDIYNISSSDIAGYAEFFENNDLEELVVEEKGTKIVFRKTGVASSAPAAVIPAAAVVPQAAAPAPSAAPAPAAASAADDGAKYKKVCSPLNGTFYAKPSPDDPPYVTVGQNVSVGQTLCMVEAMKSFNEIHSDAAGAIIKILVNDGDPVQDGQELFWIE